MDFSSLMLAFSSFLLLLLPPTISRLPKLCSTTISGRAFQKSDLHRRTSAIAATIHGRSPSTSFPTPPCRSYRSLTPTALSQISDLCLPTTIAGNGSVTSDILHLQTSGIARTILSPPTPYFSPSSRSIFSQSLSTLFSPQSASAYFHSSASRHNNRKFTAKEAKEKAFMCFICCTPGTTYNRPQDLIDHYKEKHPELYKQGKGLSCKCGAYFKDKTEKAKHGCILREVEQKDEDILMGIFNDRIVFDANQKGFNKRFRCPSKSCERHFGSALEVHNHFIDSHYIQGNTKKDDPTN